MSSCPGANEHRPNHCDGTKPFTVNHPKGDVPSCQKAFLDAIWEPIDLTSIPYPAFEQWKQDKQIIKFLKHRLDLGSSYHETLRDICSWWNLSEPIARQYAHENGFFPEMFESAARNEEVLAFLKHRIQSDVPFAQTIQEAVKWWNLPEEAILELAQKNGIGSPQKNPLEPPHQDRTDREE